MKKICPENRVEGLILYLFFLKPAADIWAGLFLVLSPKL